MNMILIAEYLQYLRKSHGYTQEDLANILDISRQAVSKWETGTTVPDLGVLLKISKLYHITINEILEPEVQPKRITEFDQIAALPEKDLKKALDQFDANSLVTALMGASPETNRSCEKMFPERDFEMIRKNIGKTRIETVEEMQKQIISMVNLQIMERK